MSVIYVQSTNLLPSMSVFVCNLVVSLEDTGLIAIERGKHLKSLKTGRREGEDERNRQPTGFETARR